MSQLRLCRLAIDGLVDVMAIDHTPQALFDALGGYMEPTELPDELARRGLIALVDEDGIGRGLPYNPFSPLLGQELLGPVLIVRTSGPDFVNLRDGDVRAIHTFLTSHLVITFERR